MYDKDINVKQNIWMIVTSYITLQAYYKIIVPNTDIKL